MPFAGYRNFPHCVSENQDKADPEAYCAVVMRDTEGAAGDMPDHVIFHDSDKIAGAAFENLRCEKMYATIRDGTVKVDWDSDQHKLLHSQDLPHSHVCITGDGKKHIMRSNVAAANDKMLAAAAHLLSDAEKEDFGLEKEGTFVMTFLLNDQKTNSGEQEGGPFKVASSAVEKIAKTVIGRPWIAEPPDPDRHIRAASAEEILQIQKHWATGEYVKAFVKAATKNAYGIVKIFPEFIERIKMKAAAGDLLKFVSPMLQVRAEQDGEITDAEIIHIQSVSFPGYSPKFAKIFGLCSGMLNKCMSEMKVLAAAGQLSEFQSRQPNILRNSKILRVKLSENETQVIQMSKGDLEKLLIEAANKAVTSYADKFKAASGAAAGTENKTEGQTADAKTADATAAQDPKVTALENKLKEMEKSIAEKDAAIVKEKRIQKATEIVGRQIALGRVKAEDKDKTIEAFVGMKLDGPTADLDLVSQFIPQPEQAPQLFAASGMPHYPAPTSGKHASFREMFDE